MSDHAPHRPGSLASGAVDLGTEEGRAFLQERLAFFAAVGFLFQTGFFLLGRVALAIVAPQLLSGPSTVTKALMIVGELAAQVLLLSAWLFLRRGRRSLGVLRALDAGLVFALCALPSLALVKGGMASSAPFAGLLILMTLLCGRAVIVPSDPRRTWRIGAASALPLLLLARDVTLPVPLYGVQARIPFLVPGILWSLCAVALSTLASAIIFGLRRRVSEARRLGQYTLEEKLGEGGMGAVYRARHAMLRRPTAVKILPPERSGAHNLKRFEREVQTTSLLSHPNTVAVYDYGRTPEGLFYYAMEYLEGLDLERLVRGFGPLPPGRAIHVLTQVAGALGEAHGFGLIHRDVKPGNVILCERGGAPDVAKVLDFGLVRDLGTARPGTESALDLVTGTPLYLSPEAITAPDRVDARSDLYAAGALLYFLLSGQNAFEGATVVEVCAHHLHTAPLPPSAKLGRPVPADLEAVVLACLEKDPARRPQTAEELRERLEGCSSAGRWGEREAREWWRRNKDRVRAVHEPGRAPGPDSSLRPMAVSLDGRLGGSPGDAARVH
jgi:serine/threonine-protein kinase